MHRQLRARSTNWLAGLVTDGLVTDINNSRDRSTVNDVTFQNRLFYSIAVEVPVAHRKIMPSVYV